MTAEPAAPIDPSPRPDPGPSYARVLVAVASFGAAAVHFAFAPDHFGESTAHGLFFFLVGWAQLLLGVAVLWRPTRSVLRAVVLVNLVVALVWAVSRITGLPVAPAAWTPEAVGFPDLVATACEVAAGVGAWFLLSGSSVAPADRRVPARVGAVLGVVGVGLVVVLTTVSVVPALGGGHDHAGAHVTAAGHDHTGAVAGAATTGHAHPDVTDPTGAVVTSGIESGNGSSPCEQAGTTVNGEGAGGHGHRGPSVQQALDEPTRALLGTQLAAAREAAARFPTAADATAAGYRRVTGYLPCIGAHYMNFRLVDGVFDPAQPEMLLYGGNGPDATMIGLSYYVSGTTVAPTGFAGPNDPWHRHIGLCVRGGAVVGGSDLTPEQCAARGGTKADGSDSWMVHAWVVPGWESAWGTFSAEHPELGRTAPS